MTIGDVVNYQGARYSLLGFDPWGVEPRLAYLEDAETGEELRVPLDDVDLAHGLEDPGR